MGRETSRCRRALSAHRAVVHDRETDVQGRRIFQYTQVPAVGGCKSRCAAGIEVEHRIAAFLRRQHEVTGKLCRTG